ncbi:MAG: cell division control 14 [Lasallia pustulata]|uniref:Cell division control 14 n=1 Tax=Lasallia pustulata TaxID=136370 RepID=A0A5M8PFC3_9LECA|nr:MAG: cell division control 14 [Lasallia pustulata]
MESLLSLSFDYLSCSDASKIRKGLKHLEGLLAQLCLCRSSSSTAADRRQSVINTGTTAQTPKELADLKDDPAFREFFKLQEGFECNVAIRLIACLERLLGRGSNGQNDLLIISTLDLLQGILLVHPPSRSLFAREIYMNLLLDLLDTSNCPAIQSSALLTLVVALLEQPHNTRTFETLDGLLTVTSLFKSRSTGRDLKLKLVEFLYFYLMPETPYTYSASAPTTAVGGQRSPSKRSGPYGQSPSGPGASDGSEIAGTKSTEEKQALLGQYLNNVEDLVEDLRGSAPFGPALG